MNNPARIVVWFSAGVTSAIAAKITADVYRDKLPIHLVLCDTGSEDEDNMRFAEDVARWVGLSLEVLHNPKYADTFDVYEQTRYLVGVKGARCSFELKKLPRREYEHLETDLQIFGFDADEPDRAIDFGINNPEVTTWFPLIEHGITKADARQILAEAGIQEPRTYGMGFKNANCLRRGCVKGGMGYWNFMRRVKPEVFANMAAMERKIGYSICHTEQRVNGRRVRVPVFLDELPEDAGNYDSEPAFQCGLFCELPQ